MRWQVTYTSTMEGPEGPPRVVEFDTWADAVRLAVNLAEIGIAAERPRVRADNYRRRYVCGVNGPTGQWHVGGAA